MNFKTKVTLVGCVGGIIIIFILFYYFIYYYLLFYYIILCGIPYSEDSN